MRKRRLAGLMTHQYKKLPVTMKIWMQFNNMPWTSLGAFHVFRVGLDVNLLHESVIYALYSERGWRKGMVGLGVSR